jgi:hypothetical protein
MTWQHKEFLTRPERYGARQETRIAAGDPDPQSKAVALFQKGGAMVIELNTDTGETVVSIYPPLPKTSKR